MVKDWHRWVFSNGRLIGYRFRWVAIQLQTLKYLLDEDSIRIHLGKSTPDLIESYQSLFEFEIDNLERHLPGKRELAISAFKCLMVAKRRLSSRDFSILVGHNDANGVPKPIDQLLHYCFSLVEYDKSTDSFRFCHLSVREFFESASLRKLYPEFEEPSIHASIATACLDLVLRRTEDSAAPLPYASVNWAYHAWKADERRTLDPLRDKIHKILRHSERIFETWKSFLNVDMRKDSWRSNDCDWPEMARPTAETQARRFSRSLWYSKPLQPLLLAVMWNFHELIPALCEGKSKRTLMGKFYTESTDTTFMPGKVTRRGRDFGLLECAAERGHLQALEILLDLGLTAENTECGLGDALAAAAKEGHIRAVRLLSKHGEQVYKEHHFNNALVCSFLHRRVKVSVSVEVIQLLLELGADANSKYLGDTSVLNYASSAGSVQAVNMLLDYGAAIDAKTSLGVEALWRACCSNHKEVVKTLLQRGANVDTQSRRGISALMVAIRDDRADITQILLDAGANVSISDEDGRDALQYAVIHKRHSVARSILSLMQRSGRTLSDSYIRSVMEDAIQTGGGIREMVESLFGEKALKELVFDQTMLQKGLMGVAKGGHVEDVEFLIRMGAVVGHPKFKHNDGLVARAANSEQMEVLKALLDAGADPNSIGRESGSHMTPLMFACWRNNLAVMEILIQCGADVNLEGDRASSGVSELEPPLVASSRLGDIAAMKLLLANGAKINCADSKYDTPLAAGAGWGQVSSVKLLLGHGANIHAVHRDSGSVLAAAAARGSIAVMKLLLEEGAIINAVGHSEGPGTALTAAAYNGWTRAVQFLLDRGADVNIVAGRYGTALSAAAARGQVELMKKFLSQGAEMNTKGVYSHKTPLIAAARNDEVDAAELLLDRGVDVNFSDSSQGTALMAASRGGGSDTIALLLKKGAEVNASGGTYGSALISCVAPEAGDTDRYSSPLHWNLDAVKLLLSWGQTPITLTRRSELH